VRIERVGDGPIVGPETDDSIGTNIQGPSLIRCPSWICKPLGRYLLYFADHKGSYIRLAAADRLDGPWRVHRPGSLHLVESGFPVDPPEADDEKLSELAELYTQLFGDSEWSHDLLVDAVTPHIASPDAHVDDAERRIVMYFHGLDSFAVQVTGAAVSTDGTVFVGRPEVLGNPYLRAFTHDGMTYALTMPGQLLRSQDGLSGFERGPRLFEPAMRRSGVTVRGDTLHVFWTRVGDSPESILHTTVRLVGDWMSWSESSTETVLGPEHHREGPTLRSSRHGVRPPTATSINSVIRPCSSTTVRTVTAVPGCSTRWPARPESRSPRSTGTADTVRTLCVSLARSPSGPP
jgi:hypothetical protein